MDPITDLCCRMVHRGLSSIFMGDTIHSGNRSSTPHFHFQMRNSNGCLTRWYLALQPCRLTINHTAEKVFFLPQEGKEKANYTNRRMSRGKRTEKKVGRYVRKWTWFWGSHLGKGAAAKEKCFPACFPKARLSSSPFLKGHKGYKPRNMRWAH